jgi:transposase-like protein
MSVDDCLSQSAEKIQKNLVERREVCANGDFRDPDGATDQGQLPTAAWPDPSVPVRGAVFRDVRRVRRLSARVRPAAELHALVATGVNGDGHREILGLQVTSAEDGAGWLAFLRDLTARGLTGVKLVTSDAHCGLTAAIGATLPGASWQRCRTHYAANLMSVTPKASWPWVKTLLHSVYDQPDSDAVHEQFDRVLDTLTDKLPVGLR